MDGILRLISSSTLSDILNWWYSSLNLIIDLLMYSSFQLDTNTFREKRLYNEQVDLVLKANKSMLLAIFDHYRQLVGASVDNL